METRSFRAAIGLVVLGALGAPTFAVTVTNTQTTVGDTAPTTAASNTDLLQTNLASVVGGVTDNNLTGPAKRNGTTGTAHENSVANPANINNTGTYDFLLDVAAFPLGYRIDEVVTYTGWQDFRAGQDHRVFYSLVGDPSFVQFGDVNIAHGGTSGGGTLRVSLTDSLGPIASGVDAIRFIVDQSTFVYREVDVHGSGIVAVPEPATAALGLMGLGGLMLRRRRHA